MTATEACAAAFRLEFTSAALTHGHPSGYLSEGVPGATVWRLLRGAELPAALEAARVELERRQGHEETSAALAATADTDENDPAEIGPPWLLLARWSERLGGQGVQVSADVDRRPGQDAPPRAR